MITDEYENDSDVEFIKFRESIANTSNDLYFKGYYDRLCTISVWKYICKN